MTRANRIREQKDRARVALPSTLINFGDMDPDNCKVIVDWAIKICKKFPKIEERLKSIEAGGEDFGWPLETNVAWHDDDDGGKKSRIVFRESKWLKDNSEIQHVVCHEFGHAAGAEIDETPEGRAVRSRFMTRRNMDSERWADAAGAYFQRMDESSGRLAKIINRFCKEERVGILNGIATWFERTFL